MPAFVMQTHFASPAVRRELARLATELPRDMELWAVGYAQDKEALHALASERLRVCAYGRADLERLPYAAKLATAEWPRLTGNADLPLLAFARDHPYYDAYWFMEYDVRLTGRWDAFLGEMARSRADLLCTHLAGYERDVRWPHWFTLATGTAEVRAADRLRGFLPLCRVSQAAVRAIDGCYRDGWCGHPEALWPTAVRHAGLSYEDIGGDGEYAPPERQGRYYHSAMLGTVLFVSTMGVFPTYLDDEMVRRAAEEAPPTLWHPVKELATAP